MLANAREPAGGLVARTGLRSAEGVSNRDLLHSAFF